MMAMKEERVGFMVQFKKLFTLRSCRRHAFRLNFVARLESIKIIMIGM